MNKRKIVFVFIFLLMFITLGLQFIIHPYSAIEDISVTMLSIIPSLISFSLFSNFNKERDAEEANKMYENLRGSVILGRYKARKTVEDYAVEESSDILELMLANMKEIKDYYVLSKTQAKNAFFLAVVMCITGFLLMGISISAAFFNTSNLVSTIVPAIGAAIVEVIAGTSLIVYKKSLEQLNHYYNSLHNNERFLSIVNMVSKVSQEKQDDMYFEIVRSQIRIISKDSAIEDKLGDKEK